MKHFFRNESYGTVVLEFKHQLWAIPNRGVVVTNDPSMAVQLSCDPRFSASSPVFKVAADIQGPPLG